MAYHHLRNFWSTHFCFCFLHTYIYTFVYILVSGLFLYLCSFVCVFLFVSSSSYFFSFTIFSCLACGETVYFNISLAQVKRACYIFQRIQGVPLFFSQYNQNSCWYLNDIVLFFFSSPLIDSLIEFYNWLEKWNERETILYLTIFIAVFLRFLRLRISTDSWFQNYPV